MLGGFFIKQKKEYIEDFEEGDEVVTPGRTITEADIVNFAGLSGDWDEIHTNAEFMEDSPFGERVAHGLLTLSVASGLSLRSNFSPKIVAFLGIDNLRFLKPVFIGDTIRVESRVMEARPSESREGVGVLETKDTVKNQNDEEVLKWESKLMIERKDNGG